MSFCSRLRKARKDCGLKQSDVANALSITESTYCGYETGKRNPDIPKLKAISKILNVSVDYLIESGFDEKEKAPTSDNSGMDARLQRISDCFNNMNAEGQNRLVEQAEFLESKYGKHSSVSSENLA